MRRRVAMRMGGEGMASHKHTDRGRPQPGQRTRIPNVSFGVVLFLFTVKVRPGRRNFPALPLELEEETSNI